jgi:hypothetical protein
MRAPKRLLIIVAASAGVVTVLCGLAYLRLTYALQHMSFFSEAHAASLITTVKGAAATLVVIKRPSEQYAVSPRGNLKAYDPAHFAGDAKLFDSWTMQVQAAQSTLEHTPSGSWTKSSTDLNYLSVSQRSDPWGHSLCLLRRSDTLAVVSAGAKATGSPLCRNIHISENELNELPKMKLLESPSGYLILVLTKRQVLPHTPQ